MSFILEVSKTGKDTILYNNRRYRESYSVKNGDVVWRCLGKTCKASIKTNTEKTAIYSSVDTHSGPHPVTMRSLTPTPPPKRRLPASTPTLALTPSPTASATVPSPVHEVLPTSAAQPTTNESPSLSNLRSENILLKEELAELRKELQAVLDHSIESDQRLLQYTDMIFLPPQSVTGSTHPGQSCTLESRDTQCRDAASPNDLDEYIRLSEENNTLQGKLKNAEEKIVNLESQIHSRDTPCNRCNILTEETSNMLSSIRMLEEEIKCLKQEKGSSLSAERHIDLEPVITHPNKFAALYDNNSHGGDESAYTPVLYKNKRKISKRANHKGNKNSIKAERTRTTIPFNNVLVVGDSHTRHLSALIKDSVKPPASVTGICKPGAGLMDIAPTSTPPPNSCFVIMAGANDVDAGRERNIFDHLETIIKRTTASSQVLLLPLPPRHDLPRNSPVHRTIQKVNSFMAGVCERYDGVNMITVRGIGRHHFTSHGLHLRASGKRLLAGMIVKKLATATLRRRHPAVIPATTMSSQEPKTEYDTYADAVLRAPTTHCAAQATTGHTEMTNRLSSMDKSTLHGQTDCNMTCHQHSVFLGPPLPRNGQN